MLMCSITKKYLTMMRSKFFLFFLLLASLTMQAKDVAFGRGRLQVTKIARNAVRIRYTEGTATSTLPDWVYVKTDEVISADINVKVNRKQGTVVVRDRAGKAVFTATAHQLSPSLVAGESTQKASLTFLSPTDECLFGLGQFQDGYANVRGLTRRLTQVNTQISIPMVISSKGYGVLWNNYGLTDFNPCELSVRMEKTLMPGKKEVVNVTSTEGGKQEERTSNTFSATLEIAEEGDYALMLDVGQQMARRHNLVIDNQTVIDMQNLWLPPTASAIVHLTAGAHTLKAQLTNNDRPVVLFRKVSDTTTFQSPVADAVDYTVFVGTPDEIIAGYREVTGAVPPIPTWALGYIHCRERFHSSDEILRTARRFRDEHLPADVFVQDWQYWGRYGWNAMRFDERFYPDPKELTDSLHAMGYRLMLSVWSKIDKNSDVGREMSEQGYYIPGTDWIDFFRPEAAAAYWQHFRQRLVPLGIDAWWQDATEPENDDLVGRRVGGGQWAGERVRNVYPLMVCKTVYEGLREQGSTPFILTRCGFPGIQRYGAALWSGDVGNDWETFRRQIVAGLGLQAAGIPWWTYDAGGFFRPQDQYTNQAYIERMLRWIETSVFLPLMRVHGYMSDTEPWRYGEQAQNIIADCLRERYLLKPYIDSCALAVSQHGSTLMRPLVFDFADDPEALQQKYEYMFGPALLVSPVTEPGVTEWRTYLPRHQGGWYDFRTGQHYDGGQYVTTPVTLARIPVFRRAGYNVATSPAQQQWVGTWATAPEYTGKGDMPRTTTLADCTLREIVRVSQGGDCLRMQLSNIFSKEPVEIKAVYIADALDSCDIVSSTARYLSFDGQRSVTIPGGQALFSDPLPYPLKPLQRLSITIEYGSTPVNATSHRGSRTTSYIMQGACAPTQAFVTSERLDHWYNIAAIDILSDTPNAIAILGNSITDGRGTTTNAQNRWTDALATALQGKAGILNLGIGGNCVIRGGLSQPGRERYDRDILGQRGLTTVVIFEGVNDIGGSRDDDKDIAQRLIATYQELAAKARRSGLKVYGATITPLGNSFYWSEAHEAARQAVNAWIRNSAGTFDAVIDFDALVRDPEQPTRLLPAYSDDWLHLNPAGYEAMGRYAAQYFQ